MIHFTIGHRRVPCEQENHGTYVTWRSLDPDLPVEVSHSNRAQALDEFRKKLEALIVHLRRP